MVFNVYVAIVAKCLEKKIVVSKTRQDIYSPNKIYI